MHTITDHANGVLTIVTDGDWPSCCPELMGYQVVEVTEYRDCFGVSRCARLILSCYNMPHDDADGDITVTHVTPDEL